MIKMDFQMDWNVSRMADDIESAEIRALYQTGFYVRKVVRNSMKKAPRKPKAGQRGRRATRPLVSRPGDPPYYRTKLLRDGIRFDVDRRTRTVTIGVAKINSPGNAPEALEFGGTTTHERWDYAERGSRAKRVTRRVRVRKRPYLAPTIELGAKKLDESFWRELRKKGF